jgi:hypothetical protein
MKPRRALIIYYDENEKALVIDDLYENGDQFSYASLSLSYILSKPLSSLYMDVGCYVILRIKEIADKLALQGKFENQEVPEEEDEN